MDLGEFSAESQRSFRALIQFPAEIESQAYSPETEMGTGRWHIREPVDDEIIGPERLDIVLVPLLCFDRSGHRVGYGKGYYDRFL